MQDVIARLESRFTDLIVALDGQDADAIVDAAAAIRPLVIEMETQAAWYEDKSKSGRFEDVMRLIDAARFRVNKLTDLNRQRASNLAFLAQPFPETIPQSR